MSRELLIVQPWGPGGWRMFIPWVQGAGDFSPLCSGVGDCSSLLSRGLEIAQFWCQGGWRSFTLFSGSWRLITLGIQGAVDCSLWYQRGWRLCTPGVQGAGDSCLLGFKGMEIVNPWCSGDWRFFTPGILWGRDCSPLVSRVLVIIRP